MSAHASNTRNSKRKRETSDASESTESDSTCSGPSICKKTEIETTPKSTLQTLQYGFRIINSNQLQCFICFNTISNQNFTGMVQHLKFSHPILQKDPLSTFQKMLCMIDKLSEEEIIKRKASWIRYTFQRNLSVQRCNPYIKYGVRTLSNGCQQCLLCSRFFFFDSNCPKDLKRHMRCSHAVEREQTVDFFIDKLIEITKSQGIELNNPNELSDELFIHEKELPLIRFGFRTLQKGHVCIICYRLFSSEYNRSTKMKHHLDTKHPMIKFEPLEFFLKKIFETEDEPEFEELIHYPMGDEELIKFGFRNFKEKVQCVLCAAFLKVESQYNPATLKSHMTFYHPNYKDSSIEYFQKMKEELEKNVMFVNINKGLFLKYGLRVENSKLQCIFCLEFLNKNNMKLEELKHHLTTRHPTMVNEFTMYFRERLMQLEGKSNQQIDSDLGQNRHNLIKYGFRYYKNYYQCLMCFKGLSSESSIPHFHRHFKYRHPSIKLPAEEFFKNKFLSLELSNAEKALIEQNRPNIGEARNLSVNEVIFSRKNPEANIIVNEKTPDNVVFVESQNKVQNNPIGITEDSEIGVLESEIETEDVKIEQVIILPNNSEEMLIENNPISPNHIELSEEYVQLKQKLNNTQVFALQIDVPIFENVSYLLTYVRFITEDDIEEKLLFCKPLIDNSLLLTFLNAVQVYELNWSNCVAIYSDCSNPELNKGSIFAKHITQMAINAKWYYGLIDLYSFVTNKISNDLIIVLEDAVNIVNLIKASSSRLSSVLNEKSGVFRQMLLHDTRYLSRGKVFNLLVELKREVAVFLTKEKFYQASVFPDPQWLIRLAYLSDIFTHLNDFVVSIEGRDKNVIILQKTIEAFLKKLTVWISRLEEGHLESFPALWNLIEVENYKEYFKSMNQLFVDHLIEIKIQLTENFLPVATQESFWILNPFSIDFVKKAGLEFETQQDLWRLSTDDSLKLTFCTKTIAQFWVSLKEFFPKLMILATEKLVPFSNSCLCELGFSSLMELKIEGGGGMNLERELMLNMNSSIVQML